MPSQVFGVRQATSGRLHPGLRLLSSPPRGRWKRLSRIRALHSGSEDVSEGLGQGKTKLEENGWEPWSNARNWTKSRTNLVDDKNIVIGDLNATLDAHRTANRLRKVTVLDTGTPPPSMGFLRLDLPNQKDDDTGTDEVEGIIRSIGTQASKATIHSAADEGKVTSREARHRGQKVERVEEYKGQDCQPNASWQLKKFPYNHSPWTDGIERTAMPGIKRLSMEIAAYERYMSLRPGEVETAREIQDMVGLITKEAIPAATVDLMGSYYDGLATSVSDMDFRLSVSMYQKDPLKRGPSPGRPEARKAIMKLLKKLREAFAASDAFEGAEIVDADIPITKVIHTRTKLALDIQMSTGPSPQQLYRANYLLEYPTLRPLYILLRSALHIRGLGTVYEGGLGSYTIFIMTVYALKSCPLNIDKTDVGGQLLYLLKFYAKADLYNTGYSLDPPSTFRKLRRNEARARVKGRTDLVAHGIHIIGKTCKNQPYLLCLQDPANPTSDLGRKSHKIKHVQKVFATAYHWITAYIHYLDTHRVGRCRDILRQGLLFPLVGANYEEFESRRKTRDRGNLKI